MVFKSPITNALILATIFLREGMYWKFQKVWKFQVVLSKIMPQQLWVLGESQQNALVILAWVFLGATLLAERF